MRTGYEVTCYEIRSGKDAVEVRYAVSAQEALFDYMRDQGCRREEIMRLGESAVSWRGAVYRAEPLDGR